MAMLDFEDEDDEREGRHEFERMEELQRAELEDDVQPGRRRLRRNHFITMSVEC